MSEKNILDLYRNDFDNPREQHYFHFFPGGKEVSSTKQFFAKASGLATGLEKLGVKRGERVMLLSDNRPEWHITDLGVVDLGAVDVPIYGTLTPTQVAYQAKDSGAVAAVVESAEQMNKFLEIKDDCPELKHLIQIEGKTAEGVLSMDEVIDSGQTGDSEDLFWQRAGKIKEEDLLTLIYTSGTTGSPKGVILTHRNLVQNVIPSCARAPVNRDDFALEFLPLCHVFERMVGYIYMSMATTKAYCSVYHVGEMLAEIRPTVFAGVPRFYEKVFDKIQGKVATASGLRQGLFGWSQKIGGQVAPLRLNGQEPSGLLALKYRLADRILSKVRDGLGGRIRFCISGGAPLPLFVNEFFHSIGVWLLEGYGLTETSPVIAVNGAAPGKTRLGTVGQALENVEVRIAEDGELLTRGPNISQGYWNLEDKTREAFDSDGFFHTGDIAEIDEDGFVSITDRKKDLIVTAGGKNVAPQPIENELKRSSFIDNAILIGDRRPYIIALISPNTEELEAWAGNQGLEYDTIEQLTRQPKVSDLYREVVESTSAGLARYEQIKKYAVLPLMLSIEGGHLTPTLKVKRRVVEKDYAKLVESLYAD
jgi:long-chain acyl-CoA synthetase